jgi:hypothetical protein
MKYEKFEAELATLQKFFPLYCHDKHDTQSKRVFALEYAERNYSFSLNLCPECETLIRYSFARLQACPHDEKPKCRTCSKPCYAKKEWKMVAAVMRYSGTQVKIQQVKEFFSFKKELKIS